ncbi:MAG: DUF1801 domain-containing protein [Gemmatimonadaceae bacterium]
MPKAKATSDDAEQQLDSFIEKFDVERQKLIRDVRKAMRKRLPTANEMVYDNYNFFVIGYSPNDRPSDAIFSIAAGANGVSVCFIQGAHLADPDKLLSGGGVQTRFLRVESAKDLVRPEVEALLAAAIAQADTPLKSAGRGTLVIRSISAKQRPRRK